MKSKRQECKKEMEIKKENIEFAIEGFYTEEQRVYHQNDNYSSRIGFDIVTLPLKKRTILSRIQNELSLNIQNELKNMQNVPFSEEDLKEFEILNAAWKNGVGKGRSHE